MKCPKNVHALAAAMKKIYGDAVGEDSSRVRCFTSSGQQWLEDQPLPVSVPRLPRGGTR